MRRGAVVPRQLLSGFKLAAAGVGATVQRATVHGAVVGLTATIRGAASTTYGEGTKSDESGG